MKIIVLLTLFLSVSSYSCDTENTPSNSGFLKDIKASHKEKEGTTCVQVLLESYSPSSNRYVYSVELNVKNNEGQVVVVVSPKAYEADNGQLVYSACFLNNHIRETVLVINSQLKRSVELLDGLSHSTSSSLCIDSEQIQLGKAIELYGKTSKEKKP